MVDTIKVSKTMNAPQKFVYQWCTDFTEEDPKLTGSSSKRKILEKSRRKVVYVTTYKGSDGGSKTSVCIVALKPNNAWHLDAYGEEDFEIGDYKLKRLGKNKTRLDMVFKETWKDIAEIPSIEEQISGTNRVWDLYVAALEKEYQSNTK
jgi:hypothetical protein